MAEPTPATQPTPGPTPEPATSPRRRPFGRLALIAVPYLWSIAFFAIPVLIVFKISLSSRATAMPPYEPLLDLSAGWGGFKAYVGALGFDNYATILSDPYYFDAYVSSLRIAAISTALLLVFGYPIAYAMAKAPRDARAILVMLVILPFWTSFLIRVYAWIGILKPEGLLNAALISLGVISEPIPILDTETAVYIGIVYSYLPFMVLPLYASLERLDGSLVEAALDLGCTPTGAFWRVTFPLSMPGVVAGSLLCFIPIVGEFVIPDLLGGTETFMIGRALWIEFFSNRDWPLASAVAVLLLLVLTIPIVWHQRRQTREIEEAGR